MTGRPSNFYLVFDILLWLLILLFGLQSGLTTYIKGKLLVEISAATNTPIDSISADVSLWKRSVELRGLRVASRGDDSFNLNVKAVSVFGINVRKLLGENQFEALKIKVSSPIFRFKASKDTLPGDEGEWSHHGRKAIGNFLRRNFYAIGAGEFIIDSMQLYTHSLLLGHQPSLSVASARFHITNFRMDSLVVEREERLFAASDLSADINGITFLTSDSLYTLTLPLFSMKYKDNSFRMDSIRLKPNFSKKDFPLRAARQIDMINMTVAGVVSNTVSVKDLMEKLTLTGSKLRVDSVKLIVFRDTYAPGRLEQKPLIQELIAGIPLPVKLDTVVIRNSYVQYDELSPPFRDPGHIAFHDLNATFINLNSRDTISEKGLNVNATARLYNRSGVEVAIDMPYSKPGFTLSGRMGPIGMKRLNAMVAGSSDMIVSQGMLDTMSFKIITDYKNANVKFQMAFRKFKIDANSKYRSDVDDVGLSIKTFLANTLVVRNKSKEVNGKPEVITFNRKYRRDKFIINNVWKSAFEGAKRSITTSAKK